MGQAPTSQMRDKFSQLSDEAFMKLADKKATELEEIFDNIDAVYVNATIEAEKLVKKLGTMSLRRKRQIGVRPKAQHKTEELPTRFRLMRMRLCEQYLMPI